MPEHLSFVVRTVGKNTSNKHLFLFRFAIDAPSTFEIVLMSSTCPNCHSPLFQDHSGASTTLAPVATTRECLECHSTWKIPVQATVSIACVLAGIGMVGLGVSGLAILYLIGDRIPVKAIVGCCALICFGAATVYRSLFPNANNQKADPKRECVDCGGALQSEVRQRCNDCAVAALPVPS